jgi:hypothetical protein
MSKTPSIAVIPSGYKASKLYSVLPTDGTGDFTTTRASVATRVNQNGLLEEVASNVPRLDYSDGGCPSLLLEGTSTNIIPYSEDFSNASWTKNGTTVSSGVLSPSGDTSAFDFFEQGTTSFKAIQNSNFSTVSGQKYTISIFAKPNGRFLQITPQVAFEQRYINYDLINGTMNLSGSDGASGTITLLSNGYYRCTYTDIANATSTVANIYYCLANSMSATRRPTYTGDGTSGIHIYGAQIEANSHATSYIKTIGTTQTRVADTASGSGNSTVINSSEGVLYAEIKGFKDDASSRCISISDGTTSNRINLALPSTQTQVIGRISSEGVTVADMVYTGITQTTFNKIAVKWKLNDFALWVNGVEVLTDSIGASPIGLNVLSFDNASAAEFLGKTKDLRVYTTALTDAELTTLTTI